MLAMAIEDVQPGWAGTAITMPAPESRSIPAPSISSVVENRSVRSCDCVNPGFFALKSAMIAAACGAAADVPKNCVGNGPAPDTATPSAAVKSGFCSTAPPVDDRSEGVIAEL